MKTIRTIVSVAFAAALGGGCTERNGSTGRPAHQSGGFSAAVASGKHSAVKDATGDWVDITGQDYQAIVRDEITKKGTTFVFVLTLAGKVGDNPTFPSWADMLLWAFAIDKDPTSPAGYDFTKNTAAPWEFVIEHRVYRSGFTDPLDPTSSPGILVDRRPLLTGGQAIVTPIQFSMEGTKLTWVVDAALLGDPATFQWADATLGASAGDDVKNGYNNISILDQAPNVNQGAPRATWPQ